MNIHMSRRLFLPAAVLGGVAVFAAVFFVALAVHSVIADPAGPVPDPGHAWTSVQGHGDDADACYVSTENDQALELRVNGARALRLEPDATSPNLIGGYSGNWLTLDVVGARIGGGGAADDGLGNPVPNRVTDDYGTVGGGRGNQAGNDAGTTSDARDATVGGGRDNSARGEVSTVGGGFLNVATTHGATVAGGEANWAGGGSSATVGGGKINTASANSATVSGGEANTVSDEYGTVAGGRNNLAGDDAGSTTDAMYATVSGGYDNEASGWYATVGGGYFNTASGVDATVGGGEGNSATGSYATVGGGYQNTASQTYATVPGGSQNTAGGDWTFAAGRRGKANHQGAFVWADSTDADFASQRNDQFRVRANGGARLDVNNGEWVEIYDDGTDLITTSTGGHLTLAGVWTNASAREMKENFTPVDGQAVLASLAEMPITTWNHKAEDSSITHMGPTAQDFYAVFGLGGSETSIGTLDADGVALAAIQGLYELSQEQAARIDALEARVAALEGGAPASGGSAGPLASIMPFGPLLLGALFVGGLVLVQRRRAGGRP